MGRIDSGQVLANTLQCLGSISMTRSRWRVYRSFRVSLDLAQEHSDGTEDSPPVSDHADADRMRLALSSQGLSCQSMSYECAWKSVWKIESGKRRMSHLDADAGAEARDVHTELLGQDSFFTTVEEAHVRDLGARPPVCRIFSSIKDVPTLSS